MDSTLFAELETTLSSQGAEAAVRRLCDGLYERKDYHALFYALLLRKRHQLGVPPLPTGPAADLPPKYHQEYEDAIRQAARQVGDLFLKAGDIPSAWNYFRMIGEPEPVRAALENYRPKEGEDIQALVQIAYYQGAHPNKGFDWILSQYGLCSAITTVSGGTPPDAPPETQQHCVRRLVRALYAELRDRLTAEIERQEGKPPGEASAPADTPGVVRRLIAGRDWLFGDNGYHIDTSHLSSVVQMSINLRPCEELDVARELCEYGRHLTGVFDSRGEKPFENFYEAYGIYLAILAGENVEENLDYFRRHAEESIPETGGTFPAEVLVNLLLRLDRPAEALAVARKHLARVDNNRLICPSVGELCQRARDYRTLAEVAREQGDAVHFVAGLLAAGK